MCRSEQTPKCLFYAPYLLSFIGEQKRRLSRSWQQNAGHHHPKFRGESSFNRIESTLVVKSGRNPCAKCLIRRTGAISPFSPIHPSTHPLIPSITFHFLSMQSRKMTCIFVRQRLNRSVVRLDVEARGIQDKTHNRRRRTSTPGPFMRSRTTIGVLEKAPSMSHPPHKGNAGKNKRKMLCVMTRRGANFDFEGREVYAS
ncbi:hypothetical protein M430DRAFT_214313 [Amorphotheca resinae ATCC 22711]|uniref:Uncharacterized protein n=1 Tax=Amorphotheca resinae ATCC 22711 TaxID=857342 RepID=A0A2T3B8J4_AMORE|nr:hypothetical protein M430DRAFT_214313 [Amorphotheca resinae ATCC 22711]PSS23184.1 hypothetical protein M430DRAFT_214313 [Amorphotheca resinae ATCC 22711]